LCGEIACPAVSCYDYLKEPLTGRIMIETAANAPMTDVSDGLNIRPNIRGGGVRPGRPGGARSDAISPVHGQETSLG
jgi:hypothetical protein